MSKFKVGDRVRCIATGGFTKLTLGKEYSVSVTDSNGDIGVDGSGMVQWSASKFVRVTKSLDNLAVDDVVVDDSGSEYPVLAVIGNAVCLGDDDGYFEGWQTVKELKDNDYTVKQDSPELTEVTLEEIAKLKGVPVEQLRIKE